MTFSQLSKHEELTEVPYATCSLVTTEFTLHRLTVV